MRYKLLNELEDFNPVIAIEDTEMEDDIFETLLESEIDDEEDDFRPEIDEY